MFDKNKHKTKLYQILTEIYRDSFLASVLGFKGGTACFFFYDLPRFSVDLDFDVIGGKDEEKIYHRLEDIYNKLGFAITDKSIKKNTVFFLLSYGEDERNIKIEASSRNLPHNFEIKNFYGFNMKVMTQADMCANKLVAITDRKKTASRDFFDAHFFLMKGWDINEEIILARTGKNLKDYLKYLKEFSDKYLTSQNILQGIGELLDEKQKDWMRKSFKKEFLGILDFYIEKMKSGELFGELS